MKTRLTTLAAAMVLAAAPAFAQMQGEGHGGHGDSAAENTGQGQGQGQGQGGMMPQMPMQMLPDQMPTPMHQGGHGQGDVDGDLDMSASSIAFRAVNEAMHHGMDIAFTGDADADFVRGMIAHHQGAIDMARIVQVFGSDSEIAALADEIVSAQQDEIAMMRDWLARKAPDHQD